MTEVRVTLSDDMVQFLERLSASNDAIRQAAEHIVAAEKALSVLGLRQEDIASVIAGRAGTTKTAVLKVMQALRRGNIDAYEVVAIYVAKKEGIGIQLVRKVLSSLDTLVKEIDGGEKAI